VRSGDDAVALTESVSEKVRNLGVGVAACRNAFHAAGRALGWPVQTVGGGSMLYAVFKDRPGSDEEQVKSDVAMRAAANAIALPATGPRLL
jgi:hypothetical protein